MINYLMADFYCSFKNRLLPFFAVAIMLLCSLSALSFGLSSSESSTGITLPGFYYAGEGLKEGYTPPETISSALGETLFSGNLIVLAPALFSILMLRKISASKLDSYLLSDGSSKTLYYLEKLAFADLAASLFYALAIASHECTLSLLGFSYPKQESPLQTMTWIICGWLAINAYTSFATAIALGVKDFRLHAPMALAAAMGLIGYSIAFLAESAMPSNPSVVILAHSLPCWSLSALSAGWEGVHGTQSVIGGIPLPFLSALMLLVAATITAGILASKRDVI